MNVVGTLVEREFGIGNPYEPGEVALALFTPYILNAFGMFDFLFVDGRCASLSYCGQDNAVLAAFGSFLVVSVPAITATAISAKWNDENWVRQRNVLRIEMERKTLEKRPPRQVDWR